MELYLLEEIGSGLVTDRVPNIGFSGKFNKTNFFIFFAKFLAYLLIFQSYVHGVCRTRRRYITLKYAKNLARIEEKLP